MKIDFQSLILLSILILGIFLRLFILGEIQSGFFRDEAALGYNAYSIWLTGKDEYGMNFPPVFRSFEVFFLPAYVYLSAPIIGILGLSEFSTRLLSSLSGIAGLIFIYLIARNLWGKTAALFCGFLLAISPWHIFYSRGAFEGNLALTFFVAGFFFWIYFLKTNRRRDFFLSIFLFTASMYSYQSERFVVPILTFYAAILSFKTLWQLKGKLIIPGLIIAFLLIPLISLSLSAGGYHRAYGVTVFAKDENPPGWIYSENPGIFINNKILLRGRQLAALYLSYFSPRNLFSEGDYEKQRSVEGSSVFYTFMFPLMLVGAWKVIKRHMVGDKLLIVWILLAPIPAAITGDPFHTYRSLMLYLPLTLLAGKGVIYIWQKIKYKKLFLTLILTLSFANLIFFVFNYTIITNASRARYWDWGYKNLVTFLLTIPDVERIVIDDPATEGYIHLLFFNKVDPTTYHTEVLTLGDPNNYYYNDPSVIRPEKIGRFEFKDVNWADVRGDKGSVFVFTPQELPDSEFTSDPKVKLINDLKYPNGEIAYRVVEII